MFKPARWWSEKNKVKVVFKLQFHASQVTVAGGDALVVSVIPADTGKPTLKSDKAAVRDGSCLWESPLYETVKFSRDPKSDKLHERIYNFVVGMGSSKAGVFGEASIDLSNYAEATKFSSVSLPLKNSKTEALLHVTIQRIQESVDQRELGDNENVKLYSEDMDGAIRGNSIEDTPFNKTVSNTPNRQASSGSDVTMSSSESSSGVVAPWELPMKNDDVGPKSDEENQKSWEWLGNSAITCTHDSLSTPTEIFVGHGSEKLKSDITALSRQVDMSELELQTLRKQIVKESKRGQDLAKELVCLKEERDALKEECEQLKSVRGRTNLLFDGVDSRAIVEELRQELNHANELNANLRIQLQKTQEANAELLLAVRDLDEMLEQKNLEITNPMKNVDEKSREAGPISQPDDDDDDEEQKALEELVREHSDAKEAYLLEQQIMDLHSEIEIYRRDRDELEIQMEQLALDYEILKQENHEMSCKLEQSQIKEELKMQFECSSSDAATNELESQVENLENELNKRSKEYADSLVTISELEARSKSLEEELEKQARGFEADLEALMCSKVEQEQRAIRAEEMLKKMRWKNANTAERLQEEFRRLSMQMASTFEANEKVVSKALAEVNELLLEKCHLEEMLRKTSEEHQSVEGHYETRLGELNSQVMSMTNEMEQQKKHAEETQKALSDKILILRDELETHIAKNKILSEEMASKETLKHELKQMRLSIKEMELLVEQGNDERVELESRLVMVENEAEGTHEELRKMSCLVKAKESEVANLQSELDVLRAQCMELKHSMLEDEQEKDKLRKQVVQLRSNVKKSEDASNSMEKKMKDGGGRGTLEVVKANTKSNKLPSRGSKEVVNLKEKIKLLEGQIKLKETALETSTNTFIQKEKDLLNKIDELEG
ncbi:hypothetical protein CDL12_00003 [Handroanthus impetiginosus]|uniref:C2 NT-type domain-containing protein n=1 Tax=Handroanthus impetiginosus TaxID=429701 RepID=A0A2G9IC59_9LAMI|nr:hypothetical protein CDL12_00003 [Handroanthus impetiginosus]